MPITYSQEIAFVRGAMMTLERLSPEPALLWEQLLSASLNQKRGLTIEDLFSLRRGDPRKVGANLKGFKDSLRHIVTVLNDRLATLVGYGLKVEVLSEKDLYYLRIEKDSLRPSPEGCFDHEFRWSVPDASPDNPPVWNKLPVWVPVHGDGEEIDIKYRPVEEHWSPPPGYSEYDNFRDERWRKYAKRHKKQSNSQGWCVQRFLPVPGKNGRRAIELTIAPIAFRDIVATTLSLRDPLPGSGTDNGEKTIEGWLRRYSDEHRATADTAGLTHFIPAANPLTVDINVVTRDEGHFLFRWYDNSKPKKPRWEPGIFGFVDSVMDVYRNALNIPDPSETVFRTSCALLGIPVHPARICWLGVGLGLKFGRVSLFGKIRLDQTADELRRVFTSPKFKIVPATAQAVKEVLHPPGQPVTRRPHFEVLLALSLAGPGRKDVKVETMTVSSHSLQDKLSSAERSSGAGRGVIV